VRTLYSTSIQVKLSKHKCTSNSSKLLVSTHTCFFSVGLSALTGPSFVLSWLVTGRMLTFSKYSREQSSTTTNAAATTDNSTAEAKPGSSSYAGTTVQRTASDGHAKWHESNGAIQCDAGRTYGSACQFTTASSTAAATGRTYLATAASSSPSPSSCTTTGMEL
jgi:hypothetical protein